LHKPGGIEIQEETESLVGEPQVRQKLCEMNGQDPFYGLDLYDDFILDQQVEPVSVLQVDLAIVYNRHQLLGHNVELDFSQFMDETDAIHAFEKTWP